MFYRSPQSTLITPNYACGLPPHQFTDRGQNTHQNTPPQPRGMQIPSEIMWPSCDNHATMHHLGHLIGRPPSWWTWDLRVPTLFIFNLFPSYCMQILL